MVYNKDNPRQWWQNPVPDPAPALYPPFYLVTCHSMMIYRNHSLCAGSFVLSGTLESFFSHSGQHWNLDIMSEQIQILLSLLVRTSQSGCSGVEERSHMMIFWTGGSRRETEMYFYSSQFSGQRSWANVWGQEG